MVCMLHVDFQKGMLETEPSEELPCLIRTSTSRRIVHSKLGPISDAKNDLHC
jgi:hypothetical protein